MIGLGIASHPRLWLPAEPVTSRGYYAHLGQGIGKYIPPQVHTYARKPLTIAMEEIVEGKVVLGSAEDSEESEDPETTEL